jgi:hypothetical protein
VAAAALRRRESDFIASSLPDESPVDNLQKEVRVDARVGACERSGVIP